MPNYFGIETELIFNNRVVPLKLIFSPELLEEKERCTWADVMGEDEQIGLTHKISCHSLLDPYIPRAMGNIPEDILILDLESRAEILNKKLREGTYQQELQDISMVRLKLDVIHIPSGSESSIDPAGSPEIPCVPLHLATPYIRNLPNRSALLVSNWRSNIINRVRFDGDSKDILRSSRKIAAFCILSDQSSNRIRLAVLFRMDALDFHIKLSLFACDEDGNIEKSEMRNCLQMVKIPKWNSTIRDLQGFSKHYLVFSTECAINFIDYSNLRKIRHYATVQSAHNINCLLADKELLGDHILLGRKEKLYMYKIHLNRDKIQLKRDRIWMTPVYVLSLSPQVPLNILRLRISANLLLVTGYDRENRGNLTFGLYEILKSYKGKRQYLQEALDITLDPRYKQSQNVKLIQQNVIIHANSDDSLICIDHTGQVISSTIWKKSDRSSSQQSFLQKSSMNDI